MNYIFSYHKINELFDSHKEINWIENTDDKVEGTFEVSNITYGVISHRVFKKKWYKSGLLNAWNFKFYLEDAGKKYFLPTNYGDEIQIMSTVINAFQEIVGIKKPDLLIWRVPEVEISKIRLYSNLIKKAANKYNYKIDISGPLKLKGYYHKVYQFILYKNIEEVEFIKKLNTKGK